MKKVLPFLQQLVSADKTAIASAIIGLLTILAAKFGFKMNGSDVAYLSAGVIAGLGLFTHAHFASRPAVPAAPAKPEPPVTPAAPAGAS